MTVNDLVRRLAQWLPGVLEDLRLPAAEDLGSSRRAPAVVCGWLPPPQDPAEQQPPLLVLRATKGSDGPEGSRVELALSLTAYADDFGGWADLSTLTQRLRSALLALRTLGPFHLDQLEWELPGEQPLPYWTAEITTTWTQPRAEWLD